MFGLSWRRKKYAGARAIITSGARAGDTYQVKDYNASTHTLTMRSWDWLRTGLLMAAAVAVAVMVVVALAVRW